MIKNKWIWIFGILLVISDVLILINHRFTTLPDFLVRISGIISMVSLIGVVYQLVRKDNTKEK